MYERQRAEVELCVADLNDADDHASGCVNNSLALIDGNDEYPSANAVKLLGCAAINIVPVLDELITDLTALSEAAANYKHSCLLRRHAWRH